MVTPGQKKLITDTAAQLVKQLVITTTLVPGQKATIELEQCDYYNVQLGDWRITVERLK